MPFSLFATPFSVLALAFALSLPAFAQSHDWPMRQTPRPETTDGVPHVQIDVQPKPELMQALLERVGSIPGIEIRPTIISLPGALGFWAADDLPLERPEVIVRGREFAHIHPDGSLHASLPPNVAKTVTAQGWAIAHPWADERDGWEGFVMIYTPMTQDELDVVMDLVTVSFSFVTGQDWVAGRY